MIRITYDPSINHAATRSTNTSRQTPTVASRHQTSASPDVVIEIALGSVAQVRTQQLDSPASQTRGPKPTNFGNIRRLENGEAGAPASPAAAGGFVTQSLTVERKHDPVSRYQPPHIPALPAPVVQSANSPQPKLPVRGSPFGYPNAPHIMAGGKCLGCRPKGVSEGDQLVMYAHHTLEACKCPDCCRYVIDITTEALALQAKYPAETYSYRALAHLYLGDDDRALEDAKKSLSMGVVGRAFAVMGILKCKKKEYADALVCLEGAIERGHPASDLVDWLALCRQQNRA